PALVIDVPKDCASFTFTPNGHQLLAVNAPTGLKDGRSTCQVYDLGTGQVTRSVALPGDATRGIAHHPHRQELAASGSGWVAVINLVSGLETKLLLTSGAGALAWHPGGELLGIAYRDRAEVWDVRAARRNWRLEHSGEGLTVSFNGTGDLFVSSGPAAGAKVWNPYTGREVLATAGAVSEFGPGDRLGMRYPTGAGEPAGPLSTVEPARVYRTLPVGIGRAHLDEFTTVSLHPKGRLLAVPSDRGVALLDLVTGIERSHIDWSRCQTALFEPSGSLLVKYPTSLQRWPVTAERGNPNQLLFGPVATVPVPNGGDSVAFSADGSVLAATAVGGATVWPRDRPREALRLEHPDCRHVAVSQDGKLVATGSGQGRGLIVWDAATGRTVRALVPALPRTVPAFSPDGEWLVCDTQRWRTADWADGPAVPTDTRFGGFSPDRRTEAWLGTGFVVLAEVGTGRELVRLEDPNQDTLTGCAFGLDGASLIGPTSGSSCVRVWDLRLIRRYLTELGLDWDAPDFPSTPTGAGTPALEVRVKASRFALDRAISPPTRPIPYAD
ncbi:MAG: hypothetical protein K2V38_23720, partial [Gemmataceae bacterium]|nr:hypothetical protein [Gemmataceae bacterium]